jgi:hypothetical protein
MSLRYSVRDCLVALLREQGMAEPAVQTTADAKLDEAVARAQPHVRHLHDFDAWDRVAKDLRDWLRP